MTISSWAEQSVTIPNRTKVSEAMTSPIKESANTPSLLRGSAILLRLTTVAETDYGHTRHWQSTAVSSLGKTLATVERHIKRPMSCGQESTLMLSRKKEPATRSASELNRVNISCIAIRQTTRTVCSGDTSLIRGDPGKSNNIEKSELTVGSNREEESGASLAAELGRANMRRITSKQVGTEIVSGDTDADRFGNYKKSTNYESGREFGAEYKSRRVVVMLKYTKPMTASSLAETLATGWRREQGPVTALEPKAGSSSAAKLVTGTETRPRRAEIGRDVRDIAEINGKGFTSLGTCEGSNTRSRESVATSGNARGLTTSDWAMNLVTTLRRRQLEAAIHPVKESTTKSKLVRKLTTVSRWERGLLTEARRVQKSTKTPSLAETPATGWRRAKRLITAMKCTEGLTIAARRGEKLATTEMIRSRRDPTRLDPGGRDGQDAASDSEAVANSGQDPSTQRDGWNIPGQDPDMRTVLDVNCPDPGDSRPDHLQTRKVNWDDQPGPGGRQKQTRVWSENLSLSQSNQLWDSESHPARPTQSEPSLRRQVSRVSMLSGDDGPDFMFPHLRPDSLTLCW